MNKYKIFLKITKNLFPFIRLLRFIKRSFQTTLAWNAFSDRKINLHKAYAVVRLCFPFNVYYFSTKIKNFTISRFIHTIIPPLSYARNIYNNPHLWRDRLCRRRGI